jgi:hypothetical protein
MIRSKRMRLARHVARVGEKRKACSRRRWVVIVKMNIGDTGWCGVDWIGVTQNGDKRRALANAVMNFRVPQIAGKLSSDFSTVGLSSNAQIYIVSWLIS